MAELEGTDEMIESAQLDLFTALYSYLDADEASTALDELVLTRLGEGVRDATDTTTVNAARQPSGSDATAPRSSPSTTPSRRRCWP
ncbi:MAG TPA: hypothetical protein VF635_05245 [Propionibacteriaceae bacterium]